MKRVGGLSTTEYDRVVLKNCGSRFLDKPFAARREGLSVSEHISKAAEVKSLKDRFLVCMTGEIPYCSAMAIYRGCLEAVTAGLAPTDATISLIFPLETEESVIKKYISEAALSAEACDIALSDISVRRSEIKQPEIAVTVSGAVRGGEAVKCEATENQNLEGSEFGASARNSSDVKTDKTENHDGDFFIVMIGKAAVEGTIILRETEALLLESNYSKQFLDTAELKKLLKADCIKRLLTEYILYSVVPGEGGVFGALWKLSERLHLGMRVNLREIRLDPLTVEICETLDVSPYEMMGGGCVLAVTDVPEAAVAVCAEMGVSASVIGILEKTNDKLIVNGEETRYLEPFKGDSLIKYESNNK